MAVPDFIISPNYKKYMCNGLLTILAGFCHVGSDLTPTPDSNLPGIRDH